MSDFVGYIFCILPLILFFGGWYISDKSPQNRRRTIHQRTEETRSLDGKVTHVSDGDGFDFLPDGAASSIRVRIVGIDAPETKQDFGETAKRFLINKVDGKRVHLTVVGQDKYGRNLSFVEAGGIDIGLQMIKDGGAWAFVNFANIPAALQHLYAASQETARENHKGLWAAAAPMAPWDWRRENAGWDGERDGDFGCTERPVAVPADDDRPIMPDDTDIVMPATVSATPVAMGMDSDGNICPFSDPIATCSFQEDTFRNDSFHDTTAFEMPSASDPFDSTFGNDFSSPSMNTCGTENF